MKKSENHLKETVRIRHSDGKDANWEEWKKTHEELYEYVDKEEQWEKMLMMQEDRDLYEEMEHPKKFTDRKVKEKVHENYFVYIEKYLNDNNIIEPE